MSEVNDQSSGEAQVVAPQASASEVAEKREPSVAGDVSVDQPGDAASVEKSQESRSPNQHQDRQRKFTKNNQDKRDRHSGGRPDRQENRQDKFRNNKNDNKNRYDRGQNQNQRPYGDHQPAGDDLDINPQSNVEVDLADINLTDAEKADLSSKNLKLMLTARKRTD